MKVDWDSHQRGGEDQAIRTNEEATWPNIIGYSSNGKAGKHAERKLHHSLILGLAMVVRGCQSPSRYHQGEKIPLRGRRADQVNDIKHGDSEIMCSSKTRANDVRITASS